jgi:hypothetical protein
MSRDRPNEISALVAELAELAKHAPARLGERVASLGIREQAELALRLPARQRLELLLHAPRPMRLVRSLPEYEFYLTVREVGPTDALPLVALASAPQLQHLLDLESWRRDRFDAGRSGAWIALLLEAGEPALRRFLRSANDEQLALLLQRWLRAEPIVPEDGHEKHGHGFTEAGDERGLVSPDGNYRLSPVIKEHAPAAQRILQLFFLDQPERYHQVMWAALHELPAEAEEQALHWRQSRLEERGFPPWEEALAVYAPPVGTSSHPRPPAPVDPDGLAAPLSLLSLPIVRDQLGPALERLGDQMRDRVLHEFFGLGNHLLVADGEDTGDPAAHRVALEKAAGYVGIALEIRGVSNAAHASETVASLPLIELFREGYASAVELQQRARSLTEAGWAATHPRALGLLDTPIRERLDALLEPRPLYYEVGDEETPGGTRPFRSTTDLRETRVALDIAEGVGRLLVDRLGLDLPRALDRQRPERAEPPRFSTFVLTFLAWHAARGELRGDPLPGDVLSDFLRNVASRRTADPEAPARALDAWVRSLRDRFALDAQEAAVLVAFGRACLEQLAAECGSLDPGTPVDPRYVPCLLIGE